MEHRHHSGGDRMTGSDLWQTGDAAEVHAAVTAAAAEVAEPSPSAQVAAAALRGELDPERAAAPSGGQSVSELHLMADISDPGTIVIAGLNLVAFAFYLGRPGFTPHVWTEAQIDRQTLRYALPVWVPDLQPRGDLSPMQGAADGQDAAAALHQLGVPRGVAVRVDMETEVSVGYLRQFRSQLNIAGYWYGPYGSASTVFGNPQGGAGYWVADWTGHPHEYDHPGVSATQYASASQAGTAWDLSELAPRALGHLWDRRPPPPWEANAAGDLTRALAEVGQAQTAVRAALTALKAHGG